jgi:hypothetical protein
VGVPKDLLALIQFQPVKYRFSVKFKKKGYSHPVVTYKTFHAIANSIHSETISYIKVLSATI